MVTTFSLYCLRLRRLLLLLLAVAYICPLAMAVDDKTMYITGRVKESILSATSPMPGYGPSAPTVRGWIHCRWVCI